MSIPTPSSQTPSTPAAPPARASGGAPSRPGQGRPSHGGSHGSHSGPRPSSGPGGRGGPGGGRGRRPPPRRKVCRFCAEKIIEVDYKAIHILRSFMTPRAKLLSGRTTGNCAKHQRQLTSAIKRAQNIALLPFIGE